jgi:hypothetical protein
MVSLTMRRKWYQGQPGQLQTRTYLKIVDMVTLRPYTCSHVIGGWFRQMGF